MPTESDARSENETKRGLFVEIDEDDPFEKIELKAITEDGVGIKIGQMSDGPGRYELKKVSKDDVDGTACVLCDEVSETPEAHEQHMEEIHDC